MSEITNLRKEILSQLKKVNQNNAPKINEQLQNATGYLSVESLIIDMVIADGITPSACIPHIESEL